MWWQYLCGIILITFGYPIGARIGTLVDDEIIAGKQYILIVRDAAFLGTIAIAAFSYEAIVLQYALPLIIIISYFWFWKYWENIYPICLPIIFFFSGSSNEVFATNGVLLFLVAVLSAAVHHKKINYSYLGVPIMGLLLTIFLFFA